MFRLSMAIVALVALLSLNAVVGNATDGAPSVPTDGLGYDCDDQSNVCDCNMADPSDCEAMLNTEYCQATERAGFPWTRENEGHGLPFYYFVDCDRTTGRCTCDMTPAATRADTSRRPEVFDPANENAAEGAGEGHEALVPPRRDAQTRTPATVNAPRSDDIVAPNNRTVDRRNETVSARRGAAPTSDTATDEAAESDEDAAPTERRVRDHR